MILWVTVVMTILASVLSLAPRLYVRLKVLRNIGWDVGLLKRRNQVLPLLMCNRTI